MRNHRSPICCILSSNWNMLQHIFIMIEHLFTHETHIYKPCCTQKPAGVVSKHLDSRQWILTGFKSFGVNVYKEETVLERTAMEFKVEVCCCSYSDKTETTKFCVFLLRRKQIRQHVFADPTATVVADDKFVVTPLDSSCIVQQVHSTANAQELVWTECCSL